MAKITKDEFISSLKEMTLLEVKELVDAMKEEFGVDPSAVAVAAAQWPIFDCLGIRGSVEIAVGKFVGSNLATLFWQFFGYLRYVKCL